MSGSNGSGPSYASLLALHELATRLSSQVDSAHREIGETRDILKDAIDRLMPAFTATRAHDAPQQAINPSRREAFSALQFQDISDQLLAHAQTRLALLQQEVDLLMSALQPGTQHDDVVAKLTTLVDQANDNLADLDLSLLKPVGKAHLGTGDAELF
jgi:phage shock protein A